MGNFCTKCGKKLNGGECENCSASHDNNRNSSKGGKQNPIIIMGIASIVVLGVGFGGYKIYNEKMQESYVVKANELIELGKFSEADEMLEKYSKGDPEVLNIKKVNKAFLGAKEKSKTEGTKGILEFKEKLYNTDYLEKYENGINEVIILSEKAMAINSLEKDYMESLEKNNFNKAMDLVRKCKKYEMTGEEKGKVERIEREILEKEKVVLEEKKKAQAKEEAERKLRNERETFLSKYRRLENKYGDDFFGDTMNSDLSMGEISAAYGRAAKEWDNFINEIWKVLPKHMSNTEFENLRKIQNEWIKDKERQIKEMDDNPNRPTGNSHIQMREMALANITKERCYQLITKYM